MSWRRVYNETFDCKRAFGINFITTYLAVPQRGTGDTACDKTELIFVVIKLFQNYSQNITPKACIR